MFHTFLCCLAFFKNHKCVLFCNLKKWDRERAWEGWRKRERQPASQRDGFCFMHFAISHVWSCPAGPCGSSDHSVKGSGAPALPFSLFTPIRRGTLASYVFVRIKWDKSSEKALSSMKLFQIQEILIIVRVRWNLQSLFSRRAFTRPPSPSAASGRCFSGEGERVGPVSCSIISPRPRPSRFPAELGCSLNFQCWFDFLQWYHMLLCKQSTWSGQTKEHVCCTPSPYHGSGNSARRGPGPRAIIFHCSWNSPYALRKRRRWRSGREQGPASLALSITALEIAAIVHGPTRASPKLLRFHFTSDRLLGDSLGKDHSPGMLSGGRGPATVYSCQSVSDGRFRHICTSLSPAVGHAGSTSNLSVY